MDFNQRFSNIHSSNRRHLHDRLVIYRLIFATSLFWICVDLCILGYLMNDSSVQVEIKSGDFAIPKSLLGRRDNDIENIFGAENGQYDVIDVRLGGNKAEKNIVVKAKTTTTSTTTSTTTTSINLPESNEEEEDIPEEKEAEPLEEDYLIEDYSDVPNNPSDWPGEEGRAVVIPDELKELEIKRFEENQFNILASDMIALNRYIPDKRDEKCKNKKFSMKLPTTSIIIVYHNEANSTLLRGLVSIVNRTPSQVLKEIILVDDASEDRDYLHKPLDEFVKTLRIPVLIFRNEERLGLIRSRLRGASAASGDTLTFLDAHIECSQGWILPLLTEVKKNRKAVVCPIIDVISDKNFAYSFGSETVYGGFDSNFVFDWDIVPERENIRRNFDWSLPMRAPTMAGGLFTIDREYFYELGSYDDGMDIWGAENIEMSLRIWMCGGTLLAHPCSHVGHVFRARSPYSFPGGANNIIYKNTRRFIDVWTDEYRDYFYQIIPALNRTDPGDLNARIKLRRDLKCKSFKWYLDNIYPEAPVPRDFIYFGQFSNPEIGYCLDSMGEVEKSTPGAFKCHSEGGMNQVFSYTKQLTIENNKYCIDLNKNNLPITVSFQRCNPQFIRQQWVYNKKTKQFRNKESKGCLGINKLNRSSLTVTKCDSKNPLQKWELSRSLLKPN